MKRILLVFLLYAISNEAFSNTIVTQKSWRWRKDDGSETSATLKSAQNVKATVTSKDEVLRLRLEFSVEPNNNNLTSTKATGDLYYSTDPEGPFTAITNSSGTNNHFTYVSSSYFAHGDATTSQMSPNSGQVYMAGKMFEGPGGTISFPIPDSESSRRVEYEWAIKPTEYAVSGNTYYFRIEPTSDANNRLGYSDPLPSLYYEIPATNNITVTSINRKTPTASLTNKSSVTFEIIMSEPVTGVTASNFELTTTGVSSASITSVTGSGTTWAATVNSGSGDGTIRLDMINKTGVEPESTGSEIPGVIIPASVNSSPVPLGGVVSSFPFRSGQEYTIDKTAPSVTISSTQASPTGTSPIPVKIDFSEDVTGFTIDDVTVSGAVKSNFQGSGKAYTLDLTPSASASITVNVGAEVALDAAGNQNTSATQFSIQYTAIKVTSIKRKTPTTSLTNKSSVTFEITMSTAVTGLTASNLSLTTTGVSGTSITNVTGSGTIWTATVNTGSGDGTIRLDMVNKTGVSLESIPVIPPYIPPYIPCIICIPYLPYTIVPLEVVVSDYPYTLGEVYTIDKTAPTVAISSTVPSPATANPIPVNIDFSEDVTGFTVSDITVSGGTAGNFAGSGKNYTADITPTSAGTITVNVGAEVALDVAGNENYSATEFSIEYSNASPATVVSIKRKSPEKEITNASKVTFEIVMSETVAGLSASNLSLTTSGVTGTSIENVTGSGTTWQVSVNTGTGDGTIRLDMINGSGLTVPVIIAQPLPFGGSAYPYTSGETYTIDKTAPAPTLSSVAGNPTNVNPIKLNIDFTEEVTGFDINDVKVEGGATSNFTGSGKNYAVDITPNGNGIITAEITVESASDEAGNDNTAATQWSVNFDDTKPSVVISSEITGLTNMNPIPVMITFSEQISEFEISDIVVSGGSASNFSGSGKIFTLDIIPSANGLITVDVAAEIASDAAANKNTAAIQYSVNYDGTKPGVSISSTVSGPTRNNPIPVKIEFTENVTGFDINDVVVTGASKADFAGSESVYTLNIIPSASGTVTVQVAEGKAKDAATNDNTSSNLFSIVYSSCKDVDAGEIEGDQTVHYGEIPVIASVETASGGNDVLAYQWESSVDGVSFKAIAGATGETYSPGTLYETISYRRKAISGGECGTAFSNVITVTIVPVEMIKHEIPNAIFPDGGEGNNTWGISHLGIKKSVRIRVVDNNGRILFHTTDPNKEWDATYSGKRVAADTYHFIIDDLNGKKVEGSVRVYY